MLRKIDLLHIITNLELGGAQKNALYTITNLDAARYNKHFICAPGGLLCKEASEILDTDFQFLSILKRKINPLKDLRALFFLTRYMRNKKIDIVHTHSSKAGILGRWAARLAGVPVIVHTIHGWSFNKYLNSPTKRLYIFLERITAWVTDKLIAVSKSDIRKGLDKGIGDKQRYTLIRCGITPAKSRDKMEISRKKMEFGLDNSSPLIGMVACFKPQKNPLDFIKAASIVLKKSPEARFVSVGDGLMRERMERLIQKRALERKVMLLGWRKDVEEIMPIFDLVVLTSLWEGLPITLLEAMACGKPIVAYKIDGVEEIVKDGINGFLVRPKDIGELSEKISLLLNDKSLSKSMGEKGREILTDSSFDVSQMITGINKIYADITNRRM